MPVVANRHFQFFCELIPLKRRTRGTFHYTPPETKKEEAYFRECFTDNYGVIRSKRPFQVELQFFVAMPKTVQREYPRLDMDNAEKSILDALNKVLWEDDDQVTGVIKFKHFSNIDPSYPMGHYPPGVIFKAHEL